MRYDDEARGFVLREAQRQVADPYRHQGQAWLQGVVDALTWVQRDDTDLSDAMNTLLYDVEQLGTLAEGWAMVDDTFQEAVGLLDEESLGSEYHRAMVEILTHTMLRHVEVDSDHARDFVETKLRNAVLNPEVAQ